MTSPGAPAPVDPRVLRPSRGWYVVAVALPIVGALAGLILFLYSNDVLFQSMQPKVATELDAGSPTAVYLTTDQRLGIYVEVAPHSSDLPPTQCAARGLDGGTIELRETSDGWATSTAHRSWREIYQISVNQNGQYELTCQPGDSTAEQGHYGVGDDPSRAGVLGNALAAAAAFLCLPGVALLAGAGLAIVVARRRGAHQRRLVTGARP